MHYDTFPPIETDAEAFKADVEAKTSAKVVVLAPGETLTAIDLVPRVGCAAVEAKVETL